MRLSQWCLGVAAINVLAGSCPAVTTINAYERRVDQPAPSPPSVIVVSSAKQLFPDDWVIEQMEGLKRTLHPVKKHPDNPLLKPQMPWEKPCILLFGTVMYDPDRDEDKFRMWYLCYTPRYNEDYTTRFEKTGRIAYATSSDGIRWVRPELGIYEYEGSKKNNIVIPGRPDSTCIIYDPGDPDPKRLYKAQIRNGGHRAYFSPDGIHWTEKGSINIDGYDRSTVHWDPTRRHWFATTKSPCLMKPDGKPRRGRGYQESKDFVHWGPVSFLCTTPDDAPDIVYNLEPFYYETLFYGIWGRYTHEPDGRLDVQLAVSRNAKHWQRPSAESWIPLSPLPEGYKRVKSTRSPATGVDPLDPRVPWDYGNNSASSLGPVRVGDELWMYYSGRTSDHRSTPNTGAIGLGTLRLDGFFSLDAGDADGTLLSRPLKLVNKTLRVNANAEGGQLRIEIVDKDGKPIPPFTVENCTPLESDSVRHLVSFKGAEDLSPVVGKTVRLRFIMKNAELYAFWTGEERRWNTPDTTTWSNSK